jgi:two-component system cell cycle response regulator
MMMDEWRVRENTSGEFGVLQSTPSEMTQAVEEARVLVVEDSPIDRQKIVETLGRDRDQVTTAAGAARAMELILAEDFDLIAVSLAMAADDPLRLTSQVRSHERSRQTPILLLAEDGDLPRVAKGLELGANDYLVKPIDRNELLARVRTQVRRRRYQERLRENYEQSLSLALTDSLTGLFNRRYLGAHMARVLGRIGETHKPVAAILFDIDHFKKVNDTWGHGVGDEVLKEVAARVSRNLRNFDMVARFGGEEFVIIMPDASVEAAAMVAERLRLKIADEPFGVSAPVGTIEVTISLGVTATEDPREDADEMIRRADRALYAAKAKGRNRIVIAGLDDVPPAILAAAGAR